MIEHAWSSLKFNIKERVTNPLIGTMIMVWTFHNWPLVYSIFNFDKNYTLKDKIDYFGSYWAEHLFWKNLALVILISLGILVLFYCLLGLAVFFKNSYNRNLLPWIDRRWKGNYRTIEDFNKLEEDRDLWQERYEKERVDKLKYASERNNIEKERNDLIIETDRLQIESERLTDSLHETADQATKLNGELNKARANLSNSQTRYSDFVSRTSRHLEFRFQLSNGEKGSIDVNRLNQIANILTNKWSPYTIGVVFRKIINQDLIDEQLSENNNIKDIINTCIREQIIIRTFIGMSKLSGFSFTQLGRVFYNAFADTNSLDEELPF